jgi:transcription elongation factor Elf1
MEITEREDKPLRCPYCGYECGRLSKEDKPSKLSLHCPLCGGEYESVLELEKHFISQYSSTEDLAAVFARTVAEKQEPSIPKSQVDTLLNLINDGNTKAIEEIKEIMEVRYVPVSKIEEKIREHEKSSLKRDRHHNVEMYDDGEVIEILKSLLPKK